MQVASNTLMSLRAAKKNLLYEKFSTDYYGSLKSSTHFPGFVRSPMGYRMNIYEESRTF